MVDDGYLIGYEDTNGDFVEVGRFNNQAEDTTQPIEVVHANSGETIELGPNGFVTDSVSAVSADVSGEVTAGSVNADDASITNVGVQAYLSSNQTVSSGTITRVQFDAVSNDDQSELDSTDNKIVVTDGGKYLIAGSVKWEGDSSWSAGDGARPILNVNGSAIGDFHTLKIGTSRQSAHVPTIKRNLSSGDEITLDVFQSSGSDQVLRGFEAESMLSVIQVG